MPVQWFYSRGGQKVVSPCPTSELRILASTGRPLPNDRARRQGMLHPIQTNRVKNLFAASDGQTS